MRSFIIISVMMMMIMMMMINDDDGDDDDDCHLFWKGADCFFFDGSSGYLELLIFSIPGWRKWEHRRNK